MRQLAHCRLHGTRPADHPAGRPAATACVRHTCRSAAPVRPYPDGTPDPFRGQGRPLVRLALLLEVGA